MFLIKKRVFEDWSCFCMNREKISFAHPDFVDPEIAIWGLTSLTDFCKRVHLFCKDRLVSDFQKKICFAQTRHLFNSLRHQELLLVSNQFQDNTFLFEINSKDIVISKLLSQLKLLPSLFELKDIDTIAIRLLLLSRAANAVTTCLLL